MTYKLTAGEGVNQLKKQDKLPFTLMMSHGTMSIEYFAPKNADTQSPHMQDEIYVIIEGHATFYRDGERIACGKHDILFVPAGMEHRFENFSGNFATWVIFYGPDGGESAK